MWSALVAPAVEPVVRSGCREVEAGLSPSQGEGGPAGELHNGRQLSCTVTTVVRCSSKRFTELEDNLVVDRGLSTIYIPRLQTELLKLAQ